jgi:ABC-type transport system involved in multi-copper enzyme maturation permease subunit
MIEDAELTQGKSVGDLGQEALWYFLHTLFAILILAAVAGTMYAMQLPQDSTNVKLAGIGLSFLIPLIGGFFITKIQKSPVAGYVWILGVILFAVACVWVLDLPTGPGLCDGCGALRKLSRTFFEINNGSGLMGGDGLLVGTLLPLSIIGYSLGAKLALGTE